MRGSTMRARRWPLLLVVATLALGLDAAAWRAVSGSRDGVVQAAPKAKTKAKSARSAKHRKKAKARRGYRVPEPVLADDPATPLGRSLERHVEAFLNATRPAYGAFVAIDPETGEILAMAERSSNPKRIAHPATTDGFPAASVFKIVTSAALLQGGHATAGTSVCYHGGSSNLTMAHLTDSPKRDRRCRTLAGAFAHSTNPVFGKLALRHLDGKGLLDMAEAFGFNRTVSVDGRKTHSRARLAKDRLALGRMAAGFVNASLSPLHGAAFAAMIANGGRWPDKVLIDGQPGGAVLSERTVATLRSMMVQAVTGGTGSRLVGAIRDPRGGGGVALKTGTLNSRDGSGLHNTWMVGYFPAKKPRVAFAALVSLNGYGPLKAGHLTRYALKTLLRLEKNRIKGS
ncbi:MAG TPA: penicillin-binding transpeptidase domain-containing protein [Myxococcota bacterium]|nr:penicillin-binding transpeptidase domain-containing protein [Myxococcota bacterium]